MKQTSLSRRYCHKMFKANNACVIPCRLISFRKHPSSFKRDQLRIISQLTTVHHEQRHFEHDQVGVDSALLAEPCPCWLLAVVLFRRLSFHFGLHSKIWKLSEAPRRTLPYFDLGSSFEVSNSFQPTLVLLSSNHFNALAREAAITRLIARNWGT